MPSTWERLYPYAPVAIQNLGISAYGLLWRHERLGGGFRASAEGFRARDHWAPERMLSYVTNELRRVLRHAFTTVPYYRRVFERAGIALSDLETFTPADLHSLPVTPKRDLRADPDEFVSGTAARSRRLSRFQSSGSTGTPITVIMDAESHRRVVAAREARSFGWAGATILGSRSMIGGRRVVPVGWSRGPFYRYNLVEKQLYFSAYHIAPEHVRSYVEAFDRYRPRLLTGYAYSHYILGRMMLDRGLTLAYQPDALVLSSEKLTPEMKDVIGRAFRARAHEEYSSAENCVLATECERGSLHSHPDFGILEVVDEEGRPLPPGREGRILGTSLLNEAQPLIRYEVGDLGVWADGGCPCGRPALPVLREVVGRLEDVVTGPDGRQIVRFHWVFLDLPGVLEGQIVQEATDRFVVRLVTNGSLEARVEAVIRERFRERLGHVSVTVEVVPEIPRTERGKFRAVVSRLRESSGRGEDAEESGGQV